MSGDPFFKDYLSTSYGGYNEGWAEDKTNQLAYNYSGLLPLDKNARILDIGPGYGVMLSLLKRLGYKNCLAVDISEEVVDFCRKKGFGEIRLITTIQDFLRQEKEAFDFISMIEVIEHIKKEEILDVCISVRESLKAEGRVIIETPNMGAVFSSLLRYYDFTHEVGFTSHSLAQLMANAGFREIEIRGFEGIIRRDPRSAIRKFLRNGLLYPTARLIRKVNDSDLTDIVLPYIYVTAIR